jgi:hypothetical protein
MQLTMMPRRANSSHFFAEMLQKLSYAWAAVELRSSRFAARVTLHAAR